MKLPPRKDLRLAKAPATRAENGDYPAEWDLREFAYSSVYFQSPPRWLIARTVWWLTLAVLGICLAVFGCWLLSFLLPTMLDKRQFEEAYMFASIPPFGGLLLYTAMTNLRSLHIWRNASIVPARIEVVHEGVPLPNWVALIGGGGLGLLGTLGVAVIRVFLLASLHVVTVEDGKRVVGRYGSTAMRPAQFGVIICGWRLPQRADALRCGIYRSIRCTPPACR